jgi:Zn-dependent metalloprotease
MNKQITLALVLSITGLGAYAQTPVKETAGKIGMQPATVEFAAGTQPDFVKGEVFIKAKGGYTSSSDVILKHSEKDVLGQEHYRYQQRVNGIPVDGATYIVHVAKGKVTGENGQWVAETPRNLATTPSISVNAALEAAMKAFGAKIYKWQLSAEERFIKKESGDAKATFYPKAELVYYSGQNEVSASKMRLAYKLDIYAHEPVGRRIYFVDATTGEVLGKRDILHTANATGTAVTAYSGTQTITTDSYNGSYRLRETGRGNGIQTFNMNLGSDYSLATDFTDADNSWDNVNAARDQFATDAHWGAEKTYDYYKNTFNRNSIDGAGFVINSYIHYGGNGGGLNAFWDGSRINYGDGSGADGYKPVTALDVCGHEITHGLTAYTANLDYYGESGALNEGFSDVFGTMIEFASKPATANWQLGEDFYTMRDMSNPKAYGQPDTYKGINWEAGDADNGGVHKNSGVLNYWFYLLANGGSGTNDTNFAYSVTGIGMQKAAAIAYRTLTVYLTSTSQFADARIYSIMAANDLYSSTEVAQVIAAWDAVNVGSDIAPATCSDTYESNDARHLAKVISVNADITAKIGTATDVDWFKFTTTAATPYLKVTLRGLPGDYDVRLYNAHNKILAISQNRNTTSESITYNVASAGTYQIVVSGYNGAYNANYCYKLRVGTSNVAQMMDSNFDTDTTDLGFAAASGPLTMNDNELNVYPNPAKEKVSVSFTSEESGTRSLSVTDLLGRTVLVKTVDVTEGINVINLPLSGVRSGIYFLNIAGMNAARFQVTE